MQNLAFSHFGAGFQTAGAANSVAADFTTASKGGKMGLSRLGHSVSGFIKGARALSLSLSLSLS